MLLCLVEHCCCGAAQLLSECLLQDVWGPIPHLASSHFTLGPQPASQPALLAQGTVPRNLSYSSVHLFIYTYIFLGIFVYEGLKYYAKGLLVIVVAVAQRKKKFPQGAGEISKFWTYLEVRKVGYAAPRLSYAALKS